MIVNYEESREIRIYFNGIFAITWGKHPFSTSLGEGGIVVGGRESSNRYVSVQVDELIFFNASLTQPQVQEIYDSY